MALREIGARLTLDGEAEWKSQLNAATREMKNLESELKAGQAAFNGQANSIEALTAKQKSLQQMQTQQTEKVNKLRQAVADATEVWGENSAKTDAVRRQYNYAQVALSKLDQELAENERYMDEARKSADQCATSIDGYGKKVKQSTSDTKAAGTSTGTLGSALSKLGVTSLASGLSITALGAAFKKAWDFVSGLVEETKELREGLAKLDVAARQAGTSFDSDLNDSLRELYSISGDMDSSMEALSNLLASGFTGGENMTAVIRNLSGAVIEFPDTLKIESLADSLQETLATGEATGQFAELLGRVGVNVDSFAAALSLCNTEAEAQDLVLRTLAGAGLSDVADAYRDTNESLVAYNEAQYDLDTAKAGFASIWSNDAAAWKEFKAGVYEEMTDFALHGFGWETILQNLAYEAGTTFYDLRDYLRSSGQSWVDWQKAVEQSGLTAAEHWQKLKPTAAETEENTRQTTALAATLRNETVPSVEDALAALDKLQAEYDAIRSSVDSAVSGFSNMSAATEQYATTADDMIAALQSQREYLASYRANLQTAADMGLSDALIEQLSDGSTQAAAYLQAIVDGGTESITKLNEEFAMVQSGKDAFVEQVASMLPEFQTQLDGITTALNDAVEDWNQYDEATTSGENTIAGLTTALSGKISTVMELGRQVGNAFMAGYNGALDINSPSRRMAEAMDYTVAGAVQEGQRKAGEMIVTGERLGHAVLAGYEQAAAGSAQLGAAGRGSAAGGGATVTNNFYPQQMDSAMVDYLLRRVDEYLGARS